MEDTLYWLIEYIKVLLGYGFIMFVWPSVVFHKYLNGKSATVRFGFCVTVQLVLISTVVLMLGLMNILNKWTMCIVFYGVFLWSLRDKLAITQEKREKFKCLITGTYGWKNFLLRCEQKIIQVIKSALSTFGKFYRSHWLEYTLLIILVVYGMLYFSWGVFHDHSFGFSDIYVHHSWIYQLKQGNPFSAGIYPEGMHCVIYCLDALFGIRLYNGLLYVPGVNVAIILVAAYCFMKELFGWRYSSLFALSIFLTFDVAGRYIMIGMARMQCPLPQEYGFAAAFLCALFLVRYLKSNQKFVFKGNVKKYIVDENLLVFIMGLAATISIHFYATIMTFFICVGIAVCSLRKIFTKKRFVPLVVAVVMGVLIPATPMVIGYATGIPLQGSLGWALGVMQGSSNSTENDFETENFETEEFETEDINMSEIVDSEQTESIEGGYISSELPGDTDLIVQEKPKLSQQIWEKIKNFCKLLYEKSYTSIYGKEIGTTLAKLSVVILLSSIVYLLLIWIVKKIFRKKKLDLLRANGYLMMVIASLIYMIFYNPRVFGLPMLVERSRIGFIGHLLAVMIIVIPLDAIYSLLSKIGLRKLWSVLSLVTVLGLVGLIYQSGNYHSYLYFELTRFSSTVDVTNDIMDSLPKDSYTIISPTEELYQVIENGRHEEILVFLQNQNRQSYTIPTEYIFIFVEKTPLKYTQYHFFDGPRWLGLHNYQELYGNYSTCPEYIVSEISDEAAGKPIMYFGKPSDSYTNWTSRTILQSKLNKWCERFNELYPHELKTYYEDENFVCYYFRQNPKFLYNLALN